jgi:hypothetical protein
LIQQSKPITGLSLQAKLAKELIKLAETYKISELVFETKATKRRSNYLTWWSKLRPILAMFPQTAVVFKDNEIIPFPNPNNIGNRALYLLICSKVDEYFQWSIKQFEGFGDKALASIKIQCTNISAEKMQHYHHMFTSLRIKDNESTTNFFRRFTYARTESEAAGNTYTEE